MSLAANALIAFNESYRGVDWNQIIHNATQSLNKDCYEL